MSSTALAGRVARPEEQAFHREMNRLRYDYHRQAQAQESVLPVINEMVHRCIDRGMFAPFPAWDYKLQEDQAPPTDEQLAYGRERMAEITARLKPWSQGKGPL